MNLYLICPWRIQFSRRTSWTRRLKPSLSHIECLELRRLLSAIHSRGHTDTIGVETSLITPAILNGTPTSGFSSVGLVGDRVENYCTGTLIAPQWVLTAAHCSEGLDDNDGRFTVGGRTYSTELVIPHPKFHPNRSLRNSSNDLALWKLSEPVEGVEPSPIYRQKPRAGTLLTLVGFGAGGDLDGENDDFGIKRVGTTVLEKVSSKLLRWRFDKPNEANTGHGDSGGPAFIQVGSKYYVAGVTVGGLVDDASFGDTAIDTRVDAYQKWIDKTMGTFGR